MYRPRTNSGRGGGGRGGVGRGGSSGAGTARLAVPRPVQTSSLKSESGVFDLTTILVPAASKGTCRIIALLRRAPAAVGQVLPRNKAACGLAVLRLNLVVTFCFL